MIFSTPKSNTIGQNVDIIVTGDGSHTLFVPGLNEHYHSTFGAIRESDHVFIQSGYQATSVNPARILEMGFGTGLNALLTLMEAERNQRTVYYHSIDKYPLEITQVMRLNYPESLGTSQAIFQQLHEADWGVPIKITDRFTLFKEEVDLIDLQLTEPCQLIYHDAFAPDLQPNLWSEEVFKKYYAHLDFGGILVTYSVKGSVKRNLKAAGFRFEKLPGPPGKREICRAWKDINI